MDRDTAQPLTTEEAKARLRAAAQELTVGQLISRRTWTVLAVSVVGGFVAGRIGITTISRALVLQRFVPLALALLLGGHRESK